MKANSTNLQRNMKAAAAIGVFSLLIACSHEPKKTAPTLNPITISPSANSAEELSMQHALMDKAYADQVDVLAPTHFDEANRYLAKADKQNQKGAASTDILTTLGYARAYLMKASQEANAVQANMAEITIARGQAVNAGARNFPNKLAPLDKKFKEFSESYATVNLAQKLNLKNDYLALELATIKTTNLGNVKTILDQAKTKGAEKITPRAYQQAVQNYNIAETLIETDRHSDPKIAKAVATATVSANRVMSLLASEQSSRNQTPEQRAVILESRDLALKQADSVITEVATESIQKSDALALQGEALALSKDQNKAHEKKEHDDKIVKDAAALFTANEADVYRQDGLLIIRLKSMNFASGRSDLPSESLAVLTKVKEVIKEIGPGAVMVEGHTDAVGAAKINQKLSENRANSVKEFFANDKVLEENKLDSIGYGYSKPLATNKTKEGRAQNRRVDIIIKPNQSI